MQMEKMAKSLDAFERALDRLDVFNALNKGSFLVPISARIEMG